jgi:SAM-dependent methyltransferase
VVSTGSAGAGAVGSADDAPVRTWTLGPRVRACAWCEQPFHQDADHSGGLVWCPRCGVATTTPWPDDAQLAAAYDRWYRPDAGRFSGLGDKIIHRTRAVLASRLHRALPAGPVLDVGAGDGNLVRAFLGHGREAVGLDPYSTGPHIRTDEIEDVGGSWAAVIFWHSLEHLRQPATALAHAASLVAPGGALVVAVPNARSYQARAFGRRWLALDLPRHLVHLSPRALLSKIEEQGLRVERVSYLRGGQVLFGWVHGLVGMLPGHPDLYDAIRRPEARQAPMSGGKRLYAVGAAAAAMPLALAATVIEVAARSGGSVYVLARRDPS